MVGDKVVYYTVYRHLYGRTEEVGRFPYNYSPGSKKPRYSMSRLWEIAINGMILTEVLSKSLNMYANKHIDSTKITIDYMNNEVLIDSIDGIWYSVEESGDV